jgi:ribonuclease HI
MREWHIYIDGASLGNPGQSGAGIVAFDEEGNEIFRDSIHLGVMTNNMAEYEALVRALHKIEQSHISTVRIYTDSLLVANQVLGRYQMKNAGLKPYLEKARMLIRTFGDFEIQYIPRESNRIADKLAKQGAKNTG